jgi:hypothetical protein
VKLSGAVVEGNVVHGGPYTFTQSPTGAVYTFDRLEYDNGPGRRRDRSNISRRESTIRTAR